MIQRTLGVGVGIIIGGAGGLGICRYSFKGSDDEKDKSQNNLVELQLGKDDMWLPNFRKSFKSNCRETNTNSYGALGAIASYHGKP